MTADPRLVLRRVRMAEIAGAIACFAGAALVGDPAWMRWVLVALGLIALSPWPGPAALLRKADDRPEVLVRDPDLRRARARRAMWITATAELALLFVVGLVVGGLSVAIVLVIVGALCVPPGVWLAGRMMRP